MKVIGKPKKPTVDSLKLSAAFLRRTSLVRIQEGRRKTQVFENQPVRGVNENKERRRESFKERQSTGWLLRRRRSPNKATPAAALKNPAAGRMLQIVPLLVTPKKGPSATMKRVDMKPL